MKTVNGTDTPPRKEDGTYDKELVEKLFMDSPFIDWTRFAESQGWRPHRTRQEFPVASWQKQKKKIVAENQADRLAAELFSRKFSWNQDVIKTLDEYPKMNDTMKMIIMAKMNEVANAYAEYNKLVIAKAPEKQLKECAWRSYKVSDLYMLAASVKTVSESKYKSLLLNNWNAESATRDTDPSQFTADSDNGGLVFKVTGVGEFKDEDIQRLLDNYLDKPAEHTDG